MSDPTTGWLTAGVGAASGLLVAALGYLGVRQRGHADDDIARDTLWATAMDNFQSQQAEELRQIRESAKITVDRLDVVVAKLQSAQEEILLCIKDRNDLALQLATARLNLDSAQLHISEEINRNKTLTARIERLEKRAAAQDVE